MKSNFFWILIFSCLVVVAGVAAVVVGWVPVSYARIYLDGELTETVNLAAVAELNTVVVFGNEGFNEIEVERGRIRVSKADCPDGACMRQGWVSSGLVPIVCLPNRLVITFEGGGESSVDAVVG